MALPVGGVIASPESRGTQPPLAFISTPPGEAIFEPNATIFFDGSQSYDPDGTITNWTWEFGDNFTVLNYPSTTHSYYYEGAYMVTLTVWDDDNMSGNFSINLTIHKNRPPVAVISDPANNSVFFTGDTISFWSLGSSDPENYSVTFYWDFGDGTAPQTTPYVEHAYQYKGNFTVSLTVRDPLGLTGIASVHLQIKPPNNPPFAWITSPTYGTSYQTNQPVEFNGSLSYDPDKDPITFEWSYGDSATGSTMVSKHSYSVPGNYTVTLVVEDNLGLCDTASIRIIVERPNTRPVAVIASPLNLSTHIVGKEIFFSSAGSYDPDGDSLAYDWVFDDGFRSSEPFVGHSFLSPGRYNIILTVSDGRASSSVNFVITVRIPNRAPVAIISSPFPDGRYAINESVYFYANGTADPDGDSLKIVWTFGDGTFMTGTDAVHVYRQAGNYNVTLTATDPSGLNASSRVQITIYLQRRMPSVSIRVSEPAGAYYVGDSAILSGMGSSDPDGLPLLYLWTLGNSLSNELGREANLTYKFLFTGRVTLTLRVSNGELENMTSCAFEVWIWPSASARIPLDQKNVSLVEGVHFTCVEDEVRFTGLGTGGAAELKFTWDFGDGTTANVQNSAHAFTKQGSYTVILTVSDGHMSDTSQLQVTVNLRPGPVVRTTASPVISYGLLAVLVVTIIGFVGLMGGTEMGLYAMFSMLFLLYTKMKREQLLDNFTRGQIHGYIMANPGTHYSSLRQVLDLNNGTLMYHLKLLEEQKMIKSRPDGIYRRFYPINMKIPEPEAGGLTEIERMILSKVQETPGITQKDVAGLLSVSASTVNYHTQVLVERNLIRRERSGMWVRYYLQDRSLVPEQSAATTAPPSQ
jgi:PKD repeat protein/predicted transcriptional regulator